MEEVVIETLEVGLTFQCARPNLGRTSFFESIIDEFAEDRELGVQHNNIRVKSDAPFLFDLMMPFLGPVGMRGTLEVGAFTAKVFFTNLMMQSDVDQLLRLVPPIGARLDTFGYTAHDVVVAVHANFRSLNGFKHFFKPREGFERTGFIGNGIFQPWDHPARLFVDVSQIVHTGAFIRWETACQDVSQSSIHACSEAFQSALRLAGLEISIREPLTP